MNCIVFAGIKLHIYFKAYYFMCCFVVDVHIKLDMVTYG